MDALNWRKASYSAGNGGGCVEAASTPGAVLIRDTQDRTGPVLRFAPGTWRRFADQVKRSLASDPDQRGTWTPVRGAECIEVASPDGAVRDTKHDAARPGAAVHPCRVRNSLTFSTTTARGLSSRIALVVASTSRLR
jgi:hypothetical protein